MALEGSAPARVAVSMSGTTAMRAWKYARRVDCPLVLYIWDLPPGATGVGSYDPVLSLGPILLRVPRLSGGYGRRRGYYSRLRYIASRAREVWVPSTMTGELVRLRFGIEARLVPYCYDSNRFRRTTCDKDSPPTLLTVGRFEAHKNHQATLQAASRLGPGVQVRLIGRGPEAATLARTARTLGVSCRIETDADDDVVADAYQRSRVTVCPSRFEGFGLTPMEAIACGTAVAASDIPAHREFVGTAAHLFQLDDEKALVSAVTRALDCDTPGRDLPHLSIPAAGTRFLSGLSSML